jgi:pimeloyl-ACP methyl ester carboxylesterase
VNVYFLSGLAADKRVFKNIQIPPHCKPVYLDWIPPEKNESLSSYSLRMAEKIDKSEPFSLIGLSFGGMVAIEIAKKLKPVYTILISSIPTSRHLPGYYKIASALRLHKVIPISLLRSAAILKRFLTTETLEEKNMLRSMIKASDPAFIRWALEAILKWNSTDTPENILQLHGDHDPILPKRFTKPTHIIQNAGHLMVLSRAEEINSILQGVFKDF